MHGGSKPLPDAPSAFTLAKELLKKSLQKLMFSESLAVRFVCPRFLQLTTA
jgi:hypothetical protein